VLVYVRRGTAEDAPALARLRWQWRIEERAEPAPERRVFVDFFTAWVVDNLATHVPFLVEVDGRIGGMAWLMLAQRVPSPRQFTRRTGDIQSVYVVPELRDSGVGSALLAGLLEYARDIELGGLTVHSGDRAIPFYRRNGFSAGPNWLELEL
jgi:GNAT superfamily N-acetyltransferase